MGNAVSVYVKTRFEGFHRWKDAPDSVGFLRDYHRHQFYVTAMFRVTGTDRELEFFTLKAEVDDFLKAFTGYANKFEYSCEQLGEILLDRFPQCQVAIVSEDDENGAHVVRTAPAGFTALVDTIEKEAEKALDLRRTPFYGVEAEGPLRGTPTLFVPACSKSVQVKLAVYRLNALHAKGLLPKVEHAYVGAGNVPGVSRRLLEDLGLAGIMTTNVTVEVHQCTPQVLEALTGLERFVVSRTREDVFPVAPYSPAAHFYKEVTDTLVVWYGQDGSSFSTSLDDPLFKQDRFVAEM